jgi:long-subunit acyl-CoA synthetase (AMP-forming)
MSTPARHRSTCHLRQSVERVFGVVLHNGYGLTETSPTISRTLYAKGSDEINIGPPIPGSRDQDRRTGR